MKKLALISIISASIFLFSGCGQSLNVTVYNATGVTSWGGGWVAVDVSTEGHSEWFVASSTALSDADCDATNSLTIKAKENDTLDVGGNGEYSTDGTTATLTPFTLPKGTKLLYGGFLDQPHWYAAVNMDSVIFYTK